MINTQDKRTKPKEVEEKKKSGRESLIKVIDIRVSLASNPWEKILNFEFGCSDEAQCLRLLVHNKLAA